MLVEYLPETAQFAGEMLQAKKSALDDIRSDSGVLALRIGRAVPEPVIEARALSIILPASGETLTFEDLVVEALDSGYALYSRDRQSTTSTTLVVMGKDVAGTLHHEGAIYGVRPLGDGLTAVYLYDAAQLRQHRELVPDFVIPDSYPEESAFLPQRAPSGTQDSRDEIDVLVVYSKGVKQAAGNIDARIALLALHSRLFYENSGITTRLRVVNSYETSYSPAAETPDDDEPLDLRRLRTPGDGYLDDALEERERVKADVVVLLVRAKSCGGGLAYKLDHRPGASELAFAVSGVGLEHCSDNDGATFAHEIGHIQGASHHLEYYGGIPEEPYTYGHGLCNAVEGWHTVMAYGDSNCPHPIPHFTNPEVLYEGAPTGGAEFHNVARLINETAIHVANFRPRSGTPTHTLPLFISASHQALQGFVRIINRSDRDGSVTIHAVDDAGDRFGPVTLSLKAKATQHFNSDDLRDGAPEKGLSGSIEDGQGNWRLSSPTVNLNRTRLRLENLVFYGANACSDRKVMQLAGGLSGSIEDGQGNWRLELETDLDIDPLAYTRPRGDGFLTSSHDVVAEVESMRWLVPIFNPGNNTAQHSWLRVANTSGTDTEVVIEGLDDRGAAPPGNEVRFTLPPNAARMLSAKALEEGASESDFEFDGSFGDGSGKWQLFVSADQPIQVMSLLLSQSGHLTNLSSTTRASSAEVLGEILANVECNLLASDRGIRSLTGFEHAVCATWLDLADNLLSDLSPVSGLTALTRLDLRDNQVSDLSPLSDLTAMTKLELDDNQISDIAPLVSNAGLDDGDIVTLTNNPLSAQSRNTHIPALQARGVEVSF